MTILLLCITSSALLKQATRVVCSQLNINPIRDFSQLVSSSSVDKCPSKFFHNQNVRSYAKMSSFLSSLACIVQ